MPPFLRVGTRSDVAALGLRGGGQLRSPVGQPLLCCRELLVTQQQGFHAFADLPALCELSEAGVLANPVQVESQGADQLAESARERIARCKVYEVESAQVYGDGCLSAWQAEDRDDAFCQRPRQIEFPGAAFRRHRTGGDEKDHRVRLADQRVQALFPVLAGGDVMAIEIALESRHLECRHQLFGKCAAVAARVGHEDLQSRDDLGRHGRVSRVGCSCAGSGPVAALRSAFSCPDCLFGAALAASA